MTADETIKRKRLTKGWVQAERDEAGGIRVIWTPDDREELSGRAPDDPAITHDYPSSDHLDDYIAWIERHYGP